MSVDETNRLRAALGLKPLNTSTTKTTATATATPRRTTTTSERARESDSVVEDAEVVRARLATAREDRLARERLSRTPHLGAVSSADDDDMHAWVRKSRRLEQTRSAETARAEQRRRADRMAKLLAAHDEEVLADEEGGEGGRVYSSRDLAGLTVKHGMERFAAGESVILTLEDRSVLADDGEGVNDDEDVLHNALIAEDDNRHDAMKEAKKMSVGRFANDMDVDGGGEEEEVAILGKYDAKGLQEARIQLGASGTVMKSDEERKAEISRKLKHGLKGTRVSLESDKKEAIAPASADFYTYDEFDAMGVKQDKKEKKKKKKEKKMRKRADAFDIDELEREVDAQERGGIATELGGDHGSRAKNAETGSAAKKAAVATESSKAFDRALEKARERSKSLAESAPPSVASVSDVNDGDDDDELQASLARARRVARIAQQSSGGQTRRGGAEALARSVRESAGEQKVSFGGGNGVGNGVGNGNGGGMVLTDAQEFVKSIDISKAGPEAFTAKPAQSVGDKIDVEMDEDDELETGVGDTGGDDDDDGGSVMPPPSAPTSSAGPESTSVGGIGETQRRGLAGMLGMLRHKGELDVDEFAGRTNDRKAWARVRKDGGSIDAAEAQRQRNIDKNSRTFDVNINRYDEFGRVLTPKEAFRQDCWQFHGIMPSKNTKEKRIRKFQDEQKLKKMDHEDTHAMQKMRIAQGVSQTPYVVLSGQVKPGQVSDPSNGLATVERGAH